jgi:hypothetical protein
LLWLGFTRTLHDLSLSNGVLAAKLSSNNCQIRSFETVISSIKTNYTHEGKLIISSKCYLPVILWLFRGGTNPSNFVFVEEEKLNN